jgi:hypothetical protein
VVVMAGVSQVMGVMAMPVKRGFDEIKESGSLAKVGNQEQRNI